MCIQKQLPGFGLPVVFDSVCVLCLCEKLVPTLTVHRHSTNNLEHTPKRTV